MAVASASVLGCSLPAKVSSSAPSPSSCFYYSPLRSGCSGFLVGGNGGGKVSSSGMAMRSMARRARGGVGTAAPPGGLGCRCLFGLGVPELVVIAGVAALVFGPKKLPEIGRGIGKTVKSFQQAAKEFETELKKEPDLTAAENPQEVSSKDGKELESSGTKESA
ncbi:unnamed protein product [Spirodela intermedia]|uniref:Uncharacterized protein n=2 Tax=Spirodela intermedia TaxID=51605 RepID=A0A7I8KN68_SPIIN|nr:unnamed protein product [Spirodela intermedia]CAA6662844.1 unnamed protein product [Spirodela intermedia]CAA7399257.1 unnamed protein product [Spirodela intermedia]